MLASGEFLEWARFADNRYGTPRAPVEEKIAAGIPALLEIDLAGARQVRRAVPEALLVFLAPPSWPELVRRLTGREPTPAGASGWRRAFFSRKSVLANAVRKYVRNRGKYAAQLSETAALGVRVLRFRTPRQAEQWLGAVAAPPTVLPGAPG